MTSTAPIPTAPTTPTVPATQATINGAQKSLVGDQQTFLTLLTAQLKNQDPLSPLDPSQFTQQLVVMTGVQQQILTNQLLQQMVNRQTSVGDPINLIGKSVTASTPDAALTGGKANWTYSLASAASSVKMQIADSTGRVVSSSNAGPTTAGEHTFSWNGKDLRGGQLPDGGPYVMTLTATDASGAAVTSKIYQRGVVASIDQTDTGAMMDLNGVKVPASSVTNVAATGATG